MGGEGDDRGWIVGWHYQLNKWTSLVAQTVKRLSTMQEAWVRPLGWEDPLEKEMAIHYSTIAWRIPWTEEPGKLSLRGRKESDTTERLHFIGLPLWLRR